MTLRGKISRISIAAIAVLAVSVTAASVLLGPRWMPYAVPYTPPALSLAFGDRGDDQPVQMAFLPSADDSPLGSFTAFDSFGRGYLSSRGLIPLHGYDPRIFSEQIASREIVLARDADEVANVDIAAKAIDGKIVAPGAEFSFNDTVGERSEDRGFRPGLMFSRGEVISGVGGGVCLVSTALYDDVVRAGYQIIERTHHSAAVRYAEPGLDAAVVYGCIDMRFKNNTPDPVLIRAAVSDGKLRVGLYGKLRNGLTVELVRKEYKELPYKIFEKEDLAVPEGTVTVKTPACPGFDVTMVRLIKLNGALVSREVLCTDHVPARNKIVLIPPKPTMVADAENSRTQMMLTEPVAEPPVTTWTLPTHESMPDLEVRLGTTKKTVP